MEELRAHDRLIEDKLLALVKAAITGEFFKDEDQQTLTGLKLLPDKPLTLRASHRKVSHSLADVQFGTSAKARDDGDIAMRSRPKQADPPELAVQLISLNT